MSRIQVQKGVFSTDLIVFFCVHQKTRKTEAKKARALRHLHQESRQNAKTYVEKTAVTQTPAVLGPRTSLFRCQLGMNNSTHNTRWLKRSRALLCAHINSYLLLFHNRQRAEEENEPEVGPVSLPCSTPEDGKAAGNCKENEADEGKSVFGETEETVLLFIVTNC